MAIGDVKMDADGYGFKEMACFECLGLSGVVDKGCEYCGGTGVLFEVIAPEGEVKSAVSSVISQINARLMPH